MKIIKSKILQKAEGRKRGKYLITLEVTDYDIEMFECLDHTYAPFKLKEQPSKENNWEGVYEVEFNEKYQRWLNKVWRCFWKLWNLYDEYDKPIPSSSKGEKQKVKLYCKNPKCFNHYLANKKIKSSSKPSSKQDSSLTKQESKK